MIPMSHLEAALELWSERRERTTCAITGNSMSPVIRHGDTLVIEHGVRDVRTGDIVVFRAPSAILAHRVVGRTGRHTYLVKGDARPDFDDPVRVDRILGKVVEIRDARGSVRLASAYWRTAGAALAVLSRVSGTQAVETSPFWRALRVPIAVKRALLPARFSLRSLAWRLLRRADASGSRAVAAGPTFREVS